LVVDPWASERDAEHEYGIKLTALADVVDVDCVVIAVAHDMFKAMSLKELRKLYKEGTAPDERVFIDVKSIFDKKAVEAVGFRYWRL
jgi:UDP-N-acetyl-D-galactosamine dehydrogenase